VETWQAREHRVMISMAVTAGLLRHPVGAFVHYGRTGHKVYRVDDYSVTGVDPLTFTVRLVNTDPAPEDQGGWWAFWCPPSRIRACSVPAHRAVQP
jgi:hypothetical protein